MEHCLGIVVSKCFCDSFSKYFHAVFSVFLFSPYLVSFFKWVIPGLFFFVLFFNSWQLNMLINKILSMTGFEPRASGIGSNRSAHWATTTALVWLIYIFTTVHFKLPMTGLKPWSFGARVTWANQSRLRQMLVQWQWRQEGRLGPTDHTMVSGWLKDRPKSE